jgi:hypothetical protein
LWLFLLLNWKERGERREEKKERKRHWRYIEALIMTPSVSLEIS